MENPSTPLRYRDLNDLYNTCSFDLTIADLMKFEEAVKGYDWRITMNEEMAAINQNHTWELTQLPPGKHVVGLKWIYKSKYNADGTLYKKKARIMAKGYSQQEGVDFDEGLCPGCTHGNRSHVSCHWSLEKVAHLPPQHQVGIPKW